MPLSPNYTFSPTTKKSAGHRLLRSSDGDTMVVEQPIRLVSCDTPEKAQYAGRQRPLKPSSTAAGSDCRTGFTTHCPVRCATT
jgi:endonuclease YncB( thermonuclease family)